MTRQSSSRWTRRWCVAVGAAACFSKCSQAGSDWLLPLQAFIPAAILGFQHMIAMLIGLITPASILGLNTNDNNTRLYLINASIIVAGVMTLIQSLGVKHPRIPFQWGAGTLSVMGVSFTTVPIAQSAVPLLMSQYPPAVAGQCIANNYGYFTAASQGPKGFQTASLAGGSPCVAHAPLGPGQSFKPFGPNGPSCLPNCTSEAFDYAWGKMLGTLCFCALVPMFISMLSYKRIKSLFPPIVVGPVIMLIGIALIGVGFGDWGGGTFCAQRVIYNGFSNNLMSAIVTNDGDYGFTSTDGISSGQNYHANGGNFGAGNGVHNVTVPVNLTQWGSAVHGLTYSANNNASTATITMTIPNMAADNPSVRGTTTMTIGGARIVNYDKTGTGLQFMNFACSESANVQMVYGATEYVGLGFLTFITIMFVETFGSPFMRNCSCVIGLLFSYAAAVWSRHRGQQYVTHQYMDAAPKITMLWTIHSSTGPNGFFPISFYPPLSASLRRHAALCSLPPRADPAPVCPLSTVSVIPFLIVFTITTCETWADTQASMEASRLDTTGKPLQILRQKGALLNDTLSGILAGLAGVLPLTTFAQNNGIISLTNVATRRVGVACGIWLLILGILSKIGAWIQSIPGPCLGGMTTFLFANVLASGMHILLQDPGALKRRNRFILAATMGCGVGVTIWPAWAREALWPIDAHMVDGSSLGKAKRGVRDAIILILSTGFVFGFFVAFILNLCLPLDKEEMDHTVHLGGHVESEETLSKEEEVELVAMA